MLSNYAHPRLKFPTGEQRILIETILSRSKLNTNDLAKIVNVSPRTIRDWKREKFHITKVATGILCQRFKVSRPLKMGSLISKWAMWRQEISRKGGLVYCERYGLPGSIESRRKGGVLGIAKLRKLGLVAPVRKFKSPRPSQRLAEFLGIMLGDGNIGKQQISITLNSIADAKYSVFVQELCNYLFGTYPKVLKRKDCNALSIYYSGVNLIRYLTEVGMIIGNKVKYQVDVPEWIKKNSKYSIACLRGLMDTDSGVFIHKYKVNGKKYKYKKICFTNRSIPLLNFVYHSLNKLGFTPKLVDNVENKKVWLYNTHEADRYLKVVKSSNYRLNKYQFGGVA